MPRPRVSVFTPSHDPRWLDECAASLLGQTFTAWEWIVLLNGAASWSPPDDPRIVVAHSECAPHVGAAKRAACAHARGEFLLELDHDDLLASTCLEAVVAAFDANPGASLVYSDFAHVLEDGAPSFDRFAAAHGWRYDLVPVDGVVYQRCHAMPPYPHNVGFIWYAPNHVRAFRRDLYEQVGGYDAELAVLDDQDLMARLYLAGPFVHVPECLYLQRIHAGNTQRGAELNARIQTETVRMHADTIGSLTAAWVARGGRAEDGVRLDLGAAHNPTAGFLSVDLHDADLCCDVRDGLPLPDSCAQVIRAVDFLEHVPHCADSACPHERCVVGVMNELHRVLAPGGLLTTSTPSTDGRGAFQDPTHCSFWNPNSWWYYTRDDQARFVPGIVARFDVQTIAEVYPTPWHELHRILYVNADLRAVKADD